MKYRVKGHAPKVKSGGGYDVNDLLDKLDKRLWALVGAWAWSLAATLAMLHTGVEVQITLHWVHLKQPKNLGIKKPSWRGLGCEGVLRRGLV